MSPLLKLLLGATIVAGATAYLAWLGASTSWQYYVLVDECTASPNAFSGQRMRVSGRVAPASLRVSSDRRSATFVLRGERSELPCECRGLLPDNLTDDMDVVVEGRLTDAGGLEGDKVITRCASKYQADGGGGPVTASSVGDARRR